MIWEKHFYCYLLCCKFLKDFLEDEKLLRWRRFQNVLKTSWKTLNVCWEGNDRSQQKLKSDEIGFLPYCFSFSLYSVLIFPILLFVSPVLHCSIPLHLSHGNEENRSIIVSSFKEVFLINNLEDFKCVLFPTRNAFKSKRLDSVVFHIQNQNSSLGIRQLNSFSSNFLNDTHGKSCVLLSSEHEWLLDCFWYFPFVYSIN